MDEEVFNMSVRKFLKKLGVTAQREIELAVREQLEGGDLQGDETLDATATVTVTAGQSVSVELRLAETAIGLDEIVVTAQKQEQRLRDVPVHRSHLDKCVARALWQKRSPAVCDTPRSEAVEETIPTAERRAALETHASYVDVVDLFCNRTTCPAVIDGKLTFRDRHHIATPYADSLAPSLERAIFGESRVGALQDWNRQRSNAQTGSVSHRGVVRVPKGSYYADQTGQLQKTETNTLAYLTPLLDIRLFDGDNDIIISHPINTILSTLNYAQRAKVHTLHDSSRGEIIWFYPDGNNTECSTAIVWNYRWGVWYQREWPFASAAELENATDAAVHVAGSNSTATGGRVYELWDTHQFDGAAFVARWITKTIYGKDERDKILTTLTKRWRWAEFVFESDSARNLLIEWLPGNAADDASATGSPPRTSASKVSTSC